MKRVFSFLLALLLVAGLVPVQAQAATNAVMGIWADENYPDDGYVSYTTGEINTWVPIVAPAGKVITFVYPPDGDTAGSLQVKLENNIWYVWIPETPSPEIGGKVTDGSGSNEGTDNTDYTITTSSDENGTVTAERANAAQGDTVKVAVEPKEGYELDKLTIIGPDGAEITPNADYSFTMPAGDVIVSATFIAKTPHSITAETDGNGTVTPSKPSATEGESITVTAEPNDTDHKLGKITVSYGETNLDITESKTFTMPASDVKIYAEFQAKQPHGIAREITAGNGNISITVNGETTTNQVSAKEGQEVTVAAVPGDGYMALPITIKAADPSVTVELKDGKFIMPDCDVTVSTSFVEAVTVTFNYNGGTNPDNVTSVDIPAGTSLSLPNTSRENYLLVGWYQDNGTKVYDETTFADDTTLTARWVYAEHTTKLLDNDFGADLAMDNEDVLKRLVNDTDLIEAQSSGQNIYVYMKVKNKTEADVPSVDKTAIAAKAGSAKIAAYLDITLWKQIGEDASKASKITNTGDAVPITMKLDAGIIPANAGSVYIVYYHGEAKEIRTGVSYNHATCELTFPASEFSTYSLVYTPYVAPAAAPASSNTYVLDNVPKTGDSNPLMGWTMLVLCSAAMLAAVAVFDKKRAR